MLRTLSIVFCSFLCVFSPIIYEFATNYLKSNNLKRDKIATNKKYVKRLHHNHYVMIKRHAERDESLDMPFVLRETNYLLNQQCGIVKDEE